MRCVSSKISPRLTRRNDATWRVTLSVARCRISSLLLDCRNDGFVRPAGRTIVYAQIKPGFLRFNSRQYQRPAACGARRSEIIDKLTFGRLYHRSYPAPSLLEKRANSAQVRKAKNFPPRPTGAAVGLKVLPPPSYRAQSGFRETRAGGSLSTKVNIPGSHVCPMSGSAREAKRLVDGHDIELWGGMCFIVRLSHKTECNPAPASAFPNGDPLRDGSKTHSMSRLIARITIW